jgi:hypothetical protein
VPLVRLLQSNTIGTGAENDIEHVVHALVDNWIRPGERLNMNYVRRHIRHYVGGILADTSAQLWERFSPRELALLREGTCGEG